MGGSVPGAIPYTAKRAWFEDHGIGMEEREEWFEPLWAAIEDERAKHQDAKAPAEDDED